MTTEQFTGSAGEMRDSPWLASEDLAGRTDVEVVIAEVLRHRNVAFDTGRTKPVVYSLRFERKKRQLVLNGCNRRALQAMFGPNTQDWIGMKISLFVDPNVKLAGKIVSGIRIRCEAHGESFDRAPRVSRIEAIKGALAADMAEPTGNDAA